MVCGRVVFVGAVVHVARSASHHATFSVIQAARWRNTLQQITRAAGFVGVAMRDYAIAFGLQNHMCHLRTSKHKKCKRMWRSCGMLVPFGKYPSLSTNPQYTRDPTPRCDTEQADSCSQLHHETDNNSPPADTQRKPIHGNMYWLASNHTMVNNQTMVNKI